MEFSSQARVSHAFGMTLAVAGTLLFSMKGIVVKLSYGYAVDSVSLLTLRMLLSVPVYVLVALVLTRGQHPLSARQYLQIGALGLCGYYGASILDLEGLQHISAGLERLILYVYPTLVLIISAVCFGRPIQGRELAAVAVCYLGLGLVFLQDLSLHAADAITGTALVLASAVAYAVFVVGSGRLVPSVGSMRFTCYAMTAAGLGIMAHFALARPSDLLAQPREVYLLGAVLALLCTVAPSFLLSAGIARIGAERAALAGMLGPAATLLLGNLLLNEPVTAGHVAGGALILAATLWLGRRY